MATHYEPSTELSGGLRREPIHAYPSIDDINGKHQHHNQATNGNESPGMRHRLRHVSQRIASRFQASKEDPPPLKQQYERTAPTLAPAPTHDTHNLRLAEESEQKTQLPAFKDFLHQPLDTLKSVAYKQGGKEFAEGISKTDATHGASVKLVLAHERISAETDGSQREADAAQEFSDLKKARQNAFVRWTVARHVRRVKAVPPERRRRRLRRDFIWTDEHGGEERMHWMEYCEHVLDWYSLKYAPQYVGASSELPDPTSAALSASVERILLTSVPFQNLVMKLTSIAFWESPSESAAYALLYFTLCVFNYVTRAIILCTLFSVLKARYYPPDIASLRTKLERSEDPSQTAQDLNELIEQHGARGWVDALIQKAGPTMQLLLEDMADFMEIAKNFSEWCDPSRTKNTLVGLFVLWLVITLTPVWLLVKISLFGLGYVFFAMIPISHRWPQYRLIVNPVTWLLWKVPTHGEWAVARLQAEAKAQVALFLHDGTGDEVTDQEPFIGPIRDPEAVGNNEPMPDEEANNRPELSVGRYRGIYGKGNGTLCLDLNQMRFEAQVTSTPKWSLRYSELKSLQKVSGAGSNADDEDILLVDTNDHEHRISGLNQRDEVFTQIIGYSGIEWQITG